MKLATGRPSALTGGLTLTGFAVLVAGCGGGSSSPAPPTPRPSARPTATPTQRPPTPSPTPTPTASPVPSPTPGPPGDALYAAGWYPSGFYGTVLLNPTTVVFNAGRRPRTLVLGSQEYPLSEGMPGALAVSLHYLFATGSGPFGNINVYQIGSSSSGYTIEAGIPPNSIVADPSGNLFVEGYGGIAVYPIGSTYPSRYLGDNKSGLMLTDRLGNLYVSEGNSVSVYGPGSSTPFETISSGISGVAGLAVSPRERLYVANSGTNSITAYAYKQTVPDETITEGLTGVGSLAVGPTGTLYAMAGSDLVAEYDAGGTALSRTVTPPSCCRGALAVDDRDALYVIGTGRWGPIYVYRSKETQTPTRQLGTSNVYQIAIGPAW